MSATIAYEKQRETHHSSPLGFDDTQPILAGRAEIEASVAEADLPALLAALAMVTGDESLIAEDLQPPLPPMGATIAPQGGMSHEMQEIARLRAVRALMAYRDAGCPSPAVPDSNLLDRIMRFLAKGAGLEYLPVLRHELGLPTDMGAPKWRYDELASDREFKVVVVGAGLSGVAAAYRLQQAGVSYTVLEKNSEVGGVWWNNTYPGCRLDTPNFAYSFSFAQKPDWPQQFSRQPEIQRYIAEVSRRADIRRNIRLETEVVSMTWRANSATWLIVARDAQGREHEHVANAVITAVGLLNRPLIPEIPGLADFKGRWFHSGEWPSDAQLEGKRVAVVGAGASAYQIVPSIVDQVASLSVFLRNPPWMLPTPNYHDDIRPGMAWLLRHVPFYGRWFRFWQFWIAAEGRLPLVQVDPDWEHSVSVGRANEKLRVECMTHLEAQLHDRPDLLEKLTPTYPPGAKRLLRDNGVWTQALKRQHSSLVTDRIARLESNAIVTQDGSRHEVDVIVFATGFQASDYLAPMRIVGRDGRDLHQWWGGDCRAFLGITIPGFPNLFMTGGPNTSMVINSSAIFSSECEVEYILSAIGEMLMNGYESIECRVDRFEEFNKKVDAENLNKAWGVSKVSSWYKNSFGRASQIWPYSLLDYWTATESISLSDYEIAKLK